MLKEKTALKQTGFLRFLYLVILLCFSIIGINGCVFLDRPSPPIIIGIPHIDNDFATITVVRKKQSSTSGTIFTLAIDNQPFVHLKHGEYTTFNIIPGDHKFDVTWDIAGFALIAPFGGAIGDSPHRYNKGINIECSMGSECFIIVETKSFNEFVKKPEDGVIIKRVESLKEDFSISNKKFVNPFIIKTE